MSDSTIDEYRNEGEKAAQQAVLYQKIYEELCNNPKIKEYYKDYDQESVEKMLADHAREKLNVLDWTPNYIIRKEGEDQKHFELAKECFKQIQQKKLFMLQCQWRAELVTLPGIETSEDFLVAAEDILNCTLIPPVSEDELSLFINYMKSEYCKGVNTYMPGYMWQLYAEYKLFLENIDKPFSIYMLLPYPAWFYYYDLMTGDSSFRVLPDIRGDKEKYYENLADSIDPVPNINEAETNQSEEDSTSSMHLEEDEEEYDALEEDAEEEDEEEDDDDTEEDDSEDNEFEIRDNEKIPFLHVVNHKLVSKFVYQCESKAIYREYLEAAGDGEWLDENELYEGSTEIINALSRIGKVLPVHPNENWLKGLEKVLDDYEFQKTKEALYPIYEQYLMYIENGISFEKLEDADYKPMHKEKILAGRKKAGEPEDFNF